ncbi:hypothetical protein D1007_54280 [Hordeum vulgare]|nr:hypothetical protein D1007_54280 [Hordeum vulgare]
MEAELCLLRSNEWELLRNLQINVANSNELYFLLSEEGERAIDMVSVIAVHTISKHVAIHQYIKGKEDLEGEADDMNRTLENYPHLATSGS